MGVRWALLGTVLAVACLLRLRPCREHALWSGLAIVGILATPFLIGVPLFAGSFLMIAASLGQRGGAKLSRLFW